MISWTAAANVVAAAMRARGIESDLPDADLKAYATAAVTEITARIGPVTGLVTRNDGGGRYLFVSPPIGTLTSVVEDGVTLTVDVDFRVGGSGAFLERLGAGYPWLWGPRVVVSYSAVAADDRYDRVVIDLVKLALEYTGLDSRRDGDYGEESKGARGGGGQQNYQLEREAIISELFPEPVLFA